MTLSFEDITAWFALYQQPNCCTEILFSVEGYPQYQFCWMGKLASEATEGKEVYWYGLARDGSEAYDYDNFQDFVSAPVFDGKCLKELWDKIEVLEIDACDPAERIRASGVTLSVPAQHAE